MAQSNEDQPVRSTGRVVRFADRKGFGFIKPDDGGEDLFVHHTNIVSDGGFRSLTVDDSVEFTVVLSDNKYQATNVTAVGGGPISAKKPEISSKRGGSYGGARLRNGGGGGYGGCYNCGDSGHIAKDCNVNVSVKNTRVCISENNNNNGGGSCFKCGERGHYMRDCPNGNSNVGGGNGGGGCYNCGAYGHLARECRNSGGGGGGGSGACYNCGGQGHLARECTSSRASGGRFGGGGNVCFHCGKEGHFARECPDTN